jgi:hypothetical protein
MHFATLAWWTFLAMLVIHRRQGREQNDVIEVMSDHSTSEAIEI